MTPHLPSEADVVVVGGGIVGLATARELLLRTPGQRVVVVEREEHLGAHQTGHNSGVVHAGIYYAPGSEKAVLCRRGVGLLEVFTATHGIPFEECGKLVIALDESEVPALEELHRRATENGVPDLAMVDATGIREIEPAATGHRALWSPHTGITDYGAVVAALAGEIEAAGGSVHTGVAVTDFTRWAGGVTVSTSAGGIRTGLAVLAAGAQSDRLAQAAGDDAGPRIVPFRGEYHRLRPGRQSLVRGLIYPVPDPQYPFLGVHFTKTVGGEVLVGPNALLALSRYGYTWRDIDVADIVDMVRWPGMWRLVARHWRAGLDELTRSLSRAAYARDAARYVPELEAADLLPAPAGVRAQALDRDGSLVDDFRISSLDGVVAVRNAPSPAATSSLAIAERIVDALP
jgi:L-2-hydroxyglutarate oxidase LhgO